MRAVALLLLGLLAASEGPAHAAVSGQTRTTIDRGEVARVLSEHHRDLESCLELCVARNEAPRGNFILEWTIDTRGVASGAKVKRSSVKSAVTNCVMAKLKTWQLPPARAVTFPFFVESLGT